MELNEILENWKIDSDFDLLILDHESQKTPKHHSKYLNIVSDLRICLLDLEEKRKKLFKIKTQYYQGLLTKDVLTRLEWPIFNLKVLKSDLPLYLESDNDIIDLDKRINTLKISIDVVNEILKQINKREFQIQNAINWTKIQNGIV